MTPDATLFSPADRVLVACSGGPDSLALLHWLHVHKEALGLASLAAFHLNHNLRDGDSDADAAFVAQTCQSWDIPCHGVSVTFELIGPESMEAAARDVRLRYLEQTASAIGANKIATGHTADDQAETVLMNVLRGAGTTGLRGIPVQRGRFVRPLLRVTRGEIESYCAEHGLTPRRDHTNFDPDYARRNKIRLELLPLLEREFNPGVKDALFRLAEIAARDADFLRKQADAALPGVTLSEADRMLTLDCQKLRVLHPALLRHVLRSAIGRVRGSLVGVTFSHVEKIADAVLFPPPSPFGLTTPAPPVTVRVTPRRLTLRISSPPSSVSPNEELF